jgi:hypothetical protein
LYILDAALTFDQYHHKKALNGGREPMPDYTQNELLDILNKAKNTNAKTRCTIYQSGITNAANYAG